MLPTLKNVLTKYGVDKAIAFTILTRVVQGLGGLVSLAFIARYLVPKEQGYYYTFASIIAIQVFFELGLSTILTQYAAHEFAYLTWTESGNLSGEEHYKYRLASLLYFCTKWFGIIAIVLFFILIFVGFYFFSSFDKTSVIEWKIPWIILSLSTSLNLFIDPILAFFDGLGEVKDMSKVRLIQKSVYILLLFIFFTLGFKLYSSPLASLVAILINYIQIVFSNRLTMLKMIWKERQSTIIDYYEEIFPYHWRIAVSWISGYFIFQLFNPVLFAISGPIVAGQMGMTIQALNGIAALSMSWISTKVPLFSGLISKQCFGELNIQFNRALKSLSFVNIVLLTVFVVVIVFLGQFFPVLRNRFIPTFPLICLSLTVLVNQIIGAWAIYMRCHKQEPVLLQAIVSAIYCTFSTLVFGHFFGLYGIVIGYFAWSILSLFWVRNIFISKKKQWHTVAIP